jgi:cytoskeletal protein CcmA (bactofilin family)
MPLFRRDTPPDSKPTARAEPAHTASRQSAPARQTYVAPGSTIQGTLGGATALTIDGEVDGEVNVTGEVEIGPSGVVRGPVSAKVVRVAGKVTGSVEATEMVDVLANGSLEGDITAPRVLIAEGAFFVGRVDMKAPKPQSGQKPEASAAKSESRRAQHADTAGASGKTGNT